MPPSDRARQTIRVTPIEGPEDALPVDYVGRTLAEKYRLERLLGKGGMGSVYLAIHQGTGRYVALKLIAPQFMRNTHFVERFKREARAAGRLRHPHIVDVTDFGFAEVEAELVAYLVMEYLDGCTLGEVLAEEKRLPLDRAVEILQQVCSAVHEAHLQGVVHRDLKPDNIWLQPNSLGGYNAKVLDFGIAKLAEAGGEGVAEVPAKALSTVAEPGAGGSSSAGLTLAGSVLGTPLYMSPEQCRGDALDARADVYSLGVIAYQMLSGTTPFSGAPAAVLKAHCSQRPIELRQRRRTIPKGVAGVVMRALEKVPERRPPTAIALANGLRAHAQGLSRLFRRAFALYSEHFPTILKLSAAAHLPVMAVVALKVGVLLSGWNPGDTPRGVVQLVLGLLKFLANALTVSTLAGLMALMVAQLEVAPLKTLELRTAFGLLRRRWRRFFLTALLAWIHVLLGLGLLVVPGLVVWAAELMWAPVVLMEDLKARAALRRSRELARRSWLGVTVAMLFQLVLPWMAEGIQGANRSVQGRELTAVESAVVELSGLTGILLTPLLSMLPALLYLKLRQLGGETLEEVMTQVAGDQDLSTWERRIRARLGRPTPSAGSSAPPRRSS
jgi:serine/threonine protein kinase